MSGVERSQTAAAAGRRDATQRAPAAPPARVFAARFWLAAIVLALGFGAGQAAAQRLSISRFTAEDGLPASQVWGIHQDRRGLLWVATTWGFARYDGERFANISVPQGLPSPNGRSILEAPDGALWFGTGDGVARYDGRSVESFRGQAGAPTGNVWGSVVDSAGRLWFGTESGLVRFADGRFSRFGSADGLASNYVYALFVARDGALWIGSRGAGVTRCELDAEGALAHCSSYAQADGLLTPIVRAIAETADGVILIGTRGGGLAVFDGQRFRPLNAPRDLPGDDIYALLVRRSGEIAIGTSAGLAICIGLEGGRCRFIDEANGLVQNDVRALHEDREGTLWIGSEGGLSQLVRDDLWSYGEAEGLPDRNVYALAADDAGGVWVGTFRGLAQMSFGRHGEPTVRRWSTEAGLGGGWVWALLRDSRGDLWVGTEAGLCRWRGSRCQAVRTPERTIDENILALVEQSPQRLWVGATTGVLRLDLAADGTVVGERRYTTADGLAADRVYALALDGQGELWAAHGEAASRLVGERFEPVAVESGLATRSARGLGLDRTGRLLVGGVGYVARRETGEEPLRFRRWGRASGLEDEVVLTLAEDSQGRFVLGTNRGVLLFDPESADGRGAILARLALATGAIATEVSHSGAFLRAVDGSWWFGFKGGVTRSPAELLPPQLAPPVVEFSRLGSNRGRIFHAPYLGFDRGPAGWLGTNVAEFPHGDNHLRAEMRALSFLHRADVRFQSRLEGDELGWSEPRKEPFRDLMNLAPGDYRLLVRASRPNGIWGEPAALDFRIQTPWWRTAAFLWSAITVGLLLVAVAIRGRGRRTARLEAELERRIAERTDDLARYAAALVEHLRTSDRATDRARRAEAGRSELFAHASHELRTPLTSILGFSELLERSLGERLEERERRYLANVRDSGELLLRQINNLLDQLKLEAGRMELHLEPLALDALVESVVSLMEGYALHRGVRLEVTIDGALPAVRSDLAKLRQILMNLLSNAIKFSPPGERVVIGVRALDSSARAEYEIAIRDLGPGIPAQAIETIFEPYRQLDGAATSTPGTGLGLAITRQFVALLGGRIEVDSGPTAGSTFRVVLPVAPDPLVAGDFPESGDFDLLHPQLLILDADRDRFATLSKVAAGVDLLAIRVGDSEALRQVASTLRPRAVVVAFDAAASNTWQELESAVAALAEPKAPVLLLPFVGERAVPIAFAALVSLDAGETAVRRALRAAGAGVRSSGRRPLALVAAKRETGVRFGSALATAGCDHFRIEGEREACAAVLEVAPDLVAADWAHALAAGEEMVVDRNRPTVSPRPLILIESEAPTREDLARLAERVGESGVALEAALLGGLRLLGGVLAARAASGTG